MPSQTMSQKQNQQITRGELRAQRYNGGTRAGGDATKEGEWGVRVFNAGSLTN